MPTNFQGAINQTLGFGAAAAALSGKVAERQDRDKLDKMAKIAESELTATKAERDKSPYPDPKKRDLNKKDRESLNETIALNQNLKGINSYREDISRRMFERNPTKENYNQMKADKYRGDIYDYLIERDEQRLQKSFERAEKRNAAKRAQRAAIAAQKVTIDGEKVSMSDLPPALQEFIKKQGGNK